MIENRIKELEEEVRKLKLYIHEISHLMLGLHDVVRGTFPPYEWYGTDLYYLMKKEGDE